MYARRWWRPDRQFLLKQAMWAAGSLCLALMIWVLLNGERLQAEHEQELAAEVVAEDQAACTRLGKPYGSQEYAACAAELDTVRSMQKQRMQREADFL